MFQWLRDLCFADHQAPAVLLTTSLGNYTRTVYYTTKGRPYIKQWGDAYFLEPSGGVAKALWVWEEFEGEVTFPTPQ
jgi:hypothetical protein